MINWDNETEEIVDGMSTDDEGDKQNTGDLVLSNAVNVRSNKILRM